jgi:hypothetical protein
VNGSARSTKRHNAKRRVDLPIRRTTVTIPDTSLELYPGARLNERCHRAQLALLQAVGPRVAESRFGLLADYPWSAPYEDVRLKAK